MTNNKKFIAKLSAITLVLGLYGCGDNGSETYTDNNAVDTTVPSSDWRLIWADEFDGSAIDPNKWTHEINCDGGGNNEQQCYTDNPENAFVSDGILNIVALPTTDENLTKPYTSARLSSKMKGDFAYGRFEARVKLPAGQGTFPAVWMMPTDAVYGGWPHSGEIDIVESVNLKVAAEDGTLESNVYGTLHYGKSWPDNSHSGTPYLLPNDQNPADDFHTYAIEWQEGEIRWYVDGYLYQTQRKSETKLDYKGDVSEELVHKGWFTHNFDIITGELKDSWDNAPFDQAFFLILNNAVGGDWAENTNNKGVDPEAFINGQAMLIDYIRVYQCDIAPLTGEGCATISAGYDEIKSENKPDGALIPGKAPNPPSTEAPTTGGYVEPLIIFNDESNPAWFAWDCCAGSTPSVEIDDEEHGAVTEFAITGDTVMGFSSRSSHGAVGGEPFDASGMAANGTIEFDLKMTASPGDTPWMFKVESDEAATAIEIALSTSVEGHSAPILNTWQHYTFNLADLAEAGLDVSSIDVLMIFPAWGSGTGAIYRVDNVIISQPVVASAEVVIFNDEANAQWLAWDCCTGSTPTIETDDADHGAVTEFAINGDTVMGFSSRAGHGAIDGVPFDASSIVATGTISFELKMTASPGDTPWMFKVESDEAATAVEIALSTSNEGHSSPELGVWQTYTFNLKDLAEAGLDVSKIDVLMIFPAWGTGTGAVYRVDNVVINDPNATNVLEIMLFDDISQPAWLAWDCCAGSTPTVTADDDTHGAVTEFAIAGDTVMGFSSRAGHGAVDGIPFDASSIVANGTISFDLKMTASPGDTTWMFKIESNEAATALEIALSTSNEGHLAPELGVWQTYTFNLRDLAEAGLDVSAIDVLMIFPAWGTGTGAVYRVDNVRIGG
ncbi:MAG: glycoside hydrolase family 16 protein [Alteromonadaceae bacterium]|nr:glycoside hydrolase family 16 protein [Alteromonadaceae bacterium]